MKIAINARFLLKDKLEGMGWFTYEIAKRLVERHPEDEFFFFFDRPPNKEFIFGTNVKPIVLFPPTRHPLLFIWWFEWSVVRALNDLKADVFFSPDNFLSLRTSVKTVLVTHDIAHVHFPEHIPLAARIYYQYFIPKFHKRADRIVTVSNFTKKEIIEQYAVPNEKIEVACNGCRPIFQPLNENKKEEVRRKYADGMPYFFYVGAVHPRKNVHRLIAAFDRFREATGSPMRLLIGGRFAWQTGEVRTAFEAAKHNKDIRFLGYLSDDELPELTASAFACTYVSLLEGFGVPLLEAMNCDVPIITSNASSMPEVAGKAGLLVDPYSVGEIANAMQRICQEDALYEQLVACGREQRQRFSWDRAAAVVYGSLLKTQNVSILK